MVRFGETPYIPVILGSLHIIPTKIAHKKATIFFSNKQFSLATENALEIDILIAVNEKVCTRSIPPIRIDCYAIQ